MRPIVSILLAAAPLLFAHPMGNFSVSHYARIEVAPGGSKLTYALDIAELPTLELLQKWDLAGREAEAIQASAKAHAGEWMANLAISCNGKPVRPRIRKVESFVTEGAGGMPVLRVQVDATLDVAPGAIEYEDRNFATRAGWKEVVIVAGPDTSLSTASHSNRDVSRALTVYPKDPNAVPPQDVRASLTWRQTTPMAVAIQAPPAPVAPAPTPAIQQAAPPAGTLVRGDFLSRLLSSRDELSWGLIGLGLLAAFGMGALHALSPGHGKTIVAAYLVGSRGTIRHAIFLGAMVTFTHTISVFALGLGVLYFQQYVAPERIIPVLGALSGLSIVFIGAWLLYQRTKALALADAQRLMQHSHGEPGIHHHDHGHSHAHAHHHHHAHSHGGGSEHSHVIPEGEVSLGSLIALGVSGGLVPCPSALILMLSAIGIGRTAFGLGMLVMFSAGLALVLMAIGMMVIHAKHLLPESGVLRNSPFFRLVPVFSAVVVMILGVLMTLTSMGWMRPVSFLS